MLLLLVAMAMNFHATCGPLSSNCTQVCSRSQMSELSFVSVCCFYSVSADDILMWICELWLVCVMEC